jgi:hypothetical protein
MLTTYPFSPFGLGGLHWPMVAICRSLMVCYSVIVHSFLWKVRCNVTFGGFIKESCSVHFHRYLDDLACQACAKITLLGKYIV